MVCEICGQDIAGLERIDPYKPFRQYDCPRCGHVEITGEAIEQLAQCSQAQRHDLCCYNRERTYRAYSPLKISTQNLEEIFSNMTVPKTVTEKLDKIIVYLGIQSEREGNEVRIDPATDYPISYARSTEDFKFHLQFLVQEKLADHHAKGKYLTYNGWRRYDELQKNPPKTNQAFVAMWFDDSMKSIYEDGIKKAIEDAECDPKLKALRIDLLEHNDPIDDRILLEIKRSRFVVADFTQHRGGVYFEAGYALGNGIPVLWTCRKRDCERMHFDTRQFSRIEWQNQNDLYKKLKRRIEGSIFP
ncbi:MAG: hypothetical protein WBW16_13885 [Bacteroidota bacterium]